MAEIPTCSVAAALLIVRSPAAGRLPKAGFRLAAWPCRQAPRPHTPDNEVCALAKWQGSLDSAGAVQARYTYYPWGGSGGVQNLLHSRSCEGGPMGLEFHVS